MRGHAACYRGGTDSGDAAENFFCGRCGSPLYVSLASQPEVVYVRAGTLDDTTWFEPQFHVWTDDKQDWFAVDADATHLDRYP